MQQNKTKDIAKWYDKFSKTQENEGINFRNKKIQEWLIKFGLKEDSKVLEIGCGVGTQTELLAEYLNEKGSILSNDLSEKSIELAKKRLKSYDNISFLSGDIVKQNIEGKFDIILLPDVLEHIPIVDHNLLFKKIRYLIKPEGFILIHIPNPNYLQWCHENTPEMLQIIDQPIHTSILVENIYPNDLYIDYLETYSIWIDNNDYQIIRLKPNPNVDYQTVSNNNSLLRKVIDKIKKIAKWPKKK
jgi:trans-aconitate 2-methyltransferase